MKKRFQIPKFRREHGGSLAVGKRRTRRPINIKKPVHLVLRSDIAKGRRSLLSHYMLIVRLLDRYAKKFHVKVHEYAVCGNHIHLFVSGSTRRELQSFFRVLPGQIAQQIMNQIPLADNETKAFEGGTPSEKKMHSKNQRTFWTYTAYTRIVSGIRDFRNVTNYVIQNTRETFGNVKYKFRRGRYPERGGTPRRETG